MRKGFIEEVTWPESWRSIWISDIKMSWWIWRTEWTKGTFGNRKVTHFWRPVRSLSKVWCVRGSMWMWKGVEQTKQDRRSAKFPTALPVQAQESALASLIFMAFEYESDKIDFLAAGSGLVLKCRRMRQWDKVGRDRNSSGTMEWHQRWKGRGRVTAYMKDMTWEIQEWKEPKMVMPLTACISYLSQLIKIFYINADLLISLWAPGNSAHVICLSKWIRQTLGKCFLDKWLELRFGLVMAAGLLVEIMWFFGTFWNLGMSLFQCNF